MLLEKVKKHYGKDLPDKSAFRNDPEAPCTVEELSEKYGSWDTFVVKYNEAPKEEEAKVEPSTSSKPAPTTKKESNSDKTK